MNEQIQLIRDEIERYKAGAISAYNPHKENAVFFLGKVVACAVILSFIDSLKQEQPEQEPEYYQHFDPDC